MPQNLGFYQLVSRVIPLRSYVGKFFVFAFISTHLPLIALIFYMANTNTPVNRGIVVGLTVAATLWGTAIVLISFYQLLRPIAYVGLQLRAFLDEDKQPDLPIHFQDEAGVLLRDVQYVLQTLHQSRQMLHLRAHQDFITGLLNRYAGEERLRDTASMTALHEETRLCMGMLNIDHFKQINDTHGHKAGDIALACVGTILQKNLHGNDWAARWGGEEFLITLFTENPEIPFERIRQQIADHLFTSKEETFKITVSIGYTCLRNGEDPSGLVKRADEALYQAKNSGRNQVVCIE